MKRFLPLLVAFVCCLSAGITILAVENPAFSVRIDGTIDTDSSHNGQGTLVVDWQIQPNKEGLTLRYAQGLRLAYDNTVLQLMTWDGADVVEDSILDKQFSSVPKAGSAGDFETDVIVFAARGTSNDTGYLNYLLGSPFDAYDCPQGTYSSLVQVRFAFRAGKSADDLTDSSIRCMTASELYETSQSTAILLNTDENELTTYEYIKHANGVATGGDTINAPAITYPNSTVGSGNYGGNSGNSLNSGNGDNSEMSVGTTSPTETELTEPDIQSSIVEPGTQIAQMPDSEQTPLSEQPVLIEAVPSSSETLSQNEVPIATDTIYPDARGLELLWALVALGAGALILALMKIGKPAQEKVVAEPASEAPDDVPENGFDAADDSAPDNAPDTATDNTPDSAPDTATDNAPDNAADAASDATSDTAPAPAPDPGCDKDTLQRTDQ